MAENYSPTGNGDNRFWIEVKCSYQVYDYEWGALLMLLNTVLREYDDGRFRNVSAFLCEKDNA